MFCRNCGSEIEEDAKFCPKCGNSVEQLEIQNYDNKPQETSNKNNTTYAAVSFWLSIIGIPLFCLCGIGLFFEVLATIFGILAVRNKENNSVMAWIGLILGACSICFCILIWLSDSK